MLKQEEKQSDLQKEITLNGLCGGHTVSKRHPKMKPFLSGVRGGVDVINCAKTESSLMKALDFIKASIEANKMILIVGTKVQARDIVRDLAMACQLPYISERWLGGTLSNFDVLKKRVVHMKALEKSKAEGGFEKYTKKEQGKMGKEMGKLNVKFGGIRILDKLPDVLFIFDMKESALAVKEAKEKGIQVVAVADSNVDPTPADFPIYASDDAVSSIKFIANKLKDVILTSRPASAAAVSVKTE